MSVDRQLADDEVYAQSRKAIVALNHEIVALEERLGAIKAEVARRIRELRMQCAHRRIVEISVPHIDEVRGKDYSVSIRFCLICGEKESGRIASTTIGVFPPGTFFFDQLREVPVARLGEDCLQKFSEQLLFQGRFDEFDGKF